MKTILWFRQDLRLSDHPLIQWALKRGGAIIPVYILDEEAEGSWRLGGASRWWLHGSLESLDRDLRSRGSRLVLRRGDSREHLLDLVRTTGADAVGWSRRHEPSCKSRDTEVEQLMTGLGCQVFQAQSNLLIEPGSVTTKTGGPYQVYTPFWNTVRQRITPLYLSDPPREFPSVDPGIQSEQLADWNLLPTKPDWAGGIRARWQPGESGALGTLDQFAPAMAAYQDRRDLPAETGTSSLSPHLHWGEISPSRIWQRAMECGPSSPGVETYMKELVWREFAYHLIQHFPHIPEQPLRREFSQFPWISDSEALRRWQKGQTGIPIVDAGMRQLWETGWMHNRVRMIVGSYLVKNLLHPWQDGAAWFWDTLVDADLASNTMGWQWVAGCGADAAPYFRIFNPVSQSEKFDPTGAYIRRFVPELARLPAKVIHAPWEQPRLLLEDFGVTLGKNYPAPQVDLGETRKRALAAYDKMRGK